jgi:hypothetical protein
MGALGNLAACFGTYLDRAWEAESRQGAHKVLHSILHISFVIYCVLNVPYFPHCGPDGGEW